MGSEDVAGGQEPKCVAETRLARAAAAGDPAARRALVDGLMDCVRNTSRYVLRNDPDADDAAQIAMVQILRRIGTFRGDGPLAVWAARIAVRTAVAFTRRERRLGRADLGDGPVQHAVPAGFGDGPLIRRRLVRCLDRLPADRRVTVVLRLVLGHTLKETAEQTGVPLNTAKDRLRVGREELRRAILEDPVLRDAFREGVP
ncbi:MAG: RNA polymerase sigma factor [Deltaproteobacteria bacterium]|nr:RNA polymerase sigma factor [Deltaproteobacteria bacterium]